jgi:predicted component of viral defense system (DUF524 family)
VAVVSTAPVPILDRQQVVVGSIDVRLLPRTGAPRIAPLLDLSNDRERDFALEAVQLLEDWEYGYEISATRAGGYFETDRPDMFSSDSNGEPRGRLRTQSFVGLLPVSVTIDGFEIGQASFEVRARKLDYLTHYRWMLRDLAEAASAILLERFAPTQLRFIPHDQLDPGTAYERFSLLQGLIRSASLTAALQHIISNPNTDWWAEPQFVAPGKGFPASSSAARAILKVGPRVPWPNSAVRGMTTLPRRVELIQLEETRDTPPNRFVKFALGRWQTLLQSLRGAIERIPDTPVRFRGLREIQEALDYVDGMLGDPFFRDVGDLAFFPANNQVLLKREGYRELLAAHAITEGAVQVSWSGGQDVFGAGQKDVASLYEFWTFLQVVKAVKRLCTSFDEAELIRLTQEGADVTLERGKEARLTGVTERLGRKIYVEVSCNRTFAPSSNRSGSWTRPMRPDCSIHLHTGNARPDDFESIWIHFDAKYRIDHLMEILGPEALEDVPARPEDEGAGRTAGRRDDLLKMHAYRDAIKRSAGSYVLYPGGLEGQADQTFHRYHEILPGLGAFALRPTETEDAEGLEPLTKFLDDALWHFASVISQHRRGRYWEVESFGESTRTATRLGWEPSLAKPPADTLVLLGFVKDQSHLNWISDNRRYNMRADGRRGSVGMTGPELGADFVILYGADLARTQIWEVAGQPELWTRERLLGSGYPSPGGSLYFCVPLGNRVVVPEGTLSPKTIQAILQRKGTGRDRGAPVVATWLELVK